MISIFLNLSIVKLSILAFLTSSIFSIFLGKYFIKAIVSYKNFLQPIRSDGPQTHLVKQGTPTLGGVLIITSFLFSIAFWLNSYNSVLITIILTALFFGAMGLVDDLMKLKNKSSQGLSGKLRLLLGGLVSILACYIFIQNYPTDIAYSVNLFFIKNTFLYFGLILSLFFGCFVMLGTANSVNLTDGLDSLASFVVFVILAGFLIYILLFLNGFLDNNLLFEGNYISKINSLPIIISALMGSLLGFIWFNGFKAEIFMGDVGSLFLGGFLGSLAVLLKLEIFLSIAGLILVLESISVILQVYYFKLSKGKRLFLMAPLHHHFEKKGLSETKVVIRILLFTILTTSIAIFFVI
jgi:phospho-N-acetylmuramoyl-pentapeptide-transferase